MKYIKINTLKEYSIFFWLVIVAMLGLFTSTIYSKNKIERIAQIETGLDNIYLRNTLIELTSNLKPRYNELKYTSEAGDTYQSIINKLEINKEEKKVILDTILKEKTLKILRINQKFIFKFDNLSEKKIEQFKIETDKKNEILFSRSNDGAHFDAKKIKKNFTKRLVYKETVITNSLYDSAINLGIKPNIIIEFARLYGFQVDFQRDIWKNDSFQII